MATTVQGDGETYLDMHFPVGGVDVSKAFWRQPARQVVPGRYARTAPDALNVVGYDFEDRLRGGSRSGLTRFIDAIPCGREFVVQGLGTVVASGYTPPGDAMQTSQAGRVVTLVVVQEGDVYIANPGDTAYTAATNSTVETPPLNFSGIVRMASLADGADPPKATMWFADGTNYVRYDPITNEVTPWCATAGTLPADAGNNTPRLICAYQGRIVLSGLLLTPNGVYASRTGDPTDFNYNDDVIEDEGQAWTLNPGAANVIGDVVTALIPYGNNTLIIGQDSRIDILSGNPNAGGRVDQITTAIGIAFGNAWCIDPAGTIWFMSNRLDLYRMTPGSQPVQVSQPIKELLQAVNTGENAITLAWDDRLQTVLMFITNLAFPQATTHYMLEARTMAFWPMSFADTGYDPLVCCVLDGNEPEDRVTLLGGYDGYIRYLDRNATKDDRKPISSYVIVVPILSKDLDDIMLKDMVAVLGLESGEVAYAVHVGNSAEQALLNDPVASGTWGPGRNFNTPIRRSGHAVYVKISATVPWSMEVLRSRVQSQGKVRARGK